MTDPPDRSNLRTDLRRLLETLAGAAAGGALLGLAGLPGGWLSGAIVAVSAMALWGRPVYIPSPLARATYVVMGTSLGGTVTPETVAGMATWPLSLLVLAVAMFALTAVVTVYLCAVHKWDRNSALLASFPGGLATVLVLAVENRADVRAVAVVQTVRVAGLAVLLPAALAAFGFIGTPVPGAAVATLARPAPLALLLAVSSLSAYAAQRLHFPGGLIFGAMVSSAILHGTGLVGVTLPWWLSICSFVVLGAVTGTRFANTNIRLLRLLAAAAVGAFIVGNIVAFGFALLAAWLLGLNTGGALLAYAPGAIDAMMVLALALHLDTAFVGAHHLARFFLVLLTMPLIVSFMRRIGPPAKRDDVDLK